MLVVGVTFRGGNRANFGFSILLLAQKGGKEVFWGFPSVRPVSGVSVDGWKNITYSELNTWDF